MTRCSADAELAAANPTSPGKFDAEVGYITGGFTWEADYNSSRRKRATRVDLIGWVTMKKRNTVKTFRGRQKSN